MAKAKQSPKKKNSDEISAQKQNNQEADAAAGDNFPPGDSMNDCVSLCQQGRWREALAVCNMLYEQAKQKNDTEMCNSLDSARIKIEYSLRRQMATSLVEASKTLLEKEFLLDVS